MKKLESETLLEYKKRVMDPISPTFCGAKWHGATIWLGHGQTVSCHLPASHDIPLSELKNNPTAIHNTSHKKYQRLSMLEGERPAECYKCWNVEDLQEDNLSERVLKTVNYTENDLNQIALVNWEQDTFLRTLEISFDRACNFACSYCGPTFSTTWAKDIKDDGPYIGLDSDKRMHYKSDAEWAEIAPKSEEVNPYIQAFWKWWDVEGGLVDTLEGLRITGGEPIMHPSVWRLFEWFKENPGRGDNIRLSINSNLVPDKEKTFQKLLDIADSVPNFEIFTSNESIGAHAEYIRDGIDYERWVINVERILNETQVQRVYVMMTINALCLNSITEFMDKILDIRKDKPTNMRILRGPILSLNPVYNPEFQSMSTFPTHILQHYTDEIQAWYDKRKEELIDIEDVHITRLLSQLNDIINNPVDADKLEQRQIDFKSFYTQYDKRRNKDFRKTFDPIIVDWYDSIKTAGEKNE
jgi:hypothetical protein